MNIVKKARETLKLTQDEFGDYIDRRTETICRYETGKMRIPKAIKLICKKIIDRRESAYFKRIN